MDWIAERVQDLGGQGDGSEEDLWRAVERLGVPVRYTALPFGWTVHVDRRAAVIYVPRHLSGPELVALLAHELGHAHLTGGMAALLHSMADDDPRILRLARLWGWKEEKTAREFAREWMGVR